LDKRFDVIRKIATLKHKNCRQVENGLETVEFILDSYGLLQNIEFLVSQISLPNVKALLGSGSENCRFLQLQFQRFHEHAGSSGWSELQHVALQGKLCHDFLAEFNIN
jgi:hypothetical protein